MPLEALADRLQALKADLARHGQAHILAFADDLRPVELGQLLDQVERLNLSEIDHLVRTVAAGGTEGVDLAGVEPAPCYTPSGDSRGAKWSPDQYRRVGEELIRQGRIAAFTVAGGQGTRLGWKGPKGTFPATPVTGKPLFRIFAEQIVAAQRRFGVRIPWYIMTSPANDAETRSFFADNNWFGLVAGDVFLFEQGTVPSLSLDGKMLLENRWTIATNPDGHGGSIKAIRASGAAEDMAARGVQHISYIQVDNPLARVIDPVFIGLHAAAPDSSGEMSSKMVPKTAPEERVGVFCRQRGKTTVIEYSDLPDQLASQRLENGALRFRAGSIAIHLISVEFVMKLTADAERFGLPYHRAIKKVPHVNPETGEHIEPSQPNAIKLETFVFDALPMAESSIVLETSRESEFAPIKNADGPDSPRTSHQLQSDLAARWLEQAGVAVPWGSDGHVDATVEVSALTALEAADLQGVDLPARINRGDAIVI